MKHLAEYRDPQTAAALTRQISQRLDREVTLMEVCGTHTVAIFRHGLRQILPDSVRLLSGPGCPVCVTPNFEIDRAIDLAARPEVILTTFGDMLRVPGSYGSLQEARASGADVRIVYSTLDALSLASSSPKRSVVFFGVGFETTAPTVAAAVSAAQRQGLPNFSVFSAHKVIPPAMRALLDSGEVRIDGFICPGHVSAIIGATAYEFIAREYGIPCVITGFEPIDILQGIDMLLTQIGEDRAAVEIQYRRGVRPEGNPVALRLLDEVFELVQANWRGLGIIPDSGLGLRAEYRNLDAAHLFPYEGPATREPVGCLCGEILRGVKTPPECPLYARACTPESPVGPCMVSTEGTCAAWYQYHS